MKNHILIMSKFPRAGEVNTRMIPEIGAEKAAAVHQRMAEHIISITGNISSVRTIVHIANSSASEANQWLGADEWVAQKGNDLGERMKNAVEYSLKEEAEKVLVVGTDCPSLDAEILELAFQALEKDDVVYIPAQDGGYVLVGMKALQPAAFLDIDWGTENVLEQSLAHLVKDSVTYKLLKPLNDIDFSKDIPVEFL